MLRCVMLFLLALAPITRAESITLDKPLYAEVFTNAANPRPTKISGNLVSYDEQTFVLHVGKEDKTIQWSEITTTSAYTLRKRVIDESKASDWLELGMFAQGIGAKEQAQAAIRTAVRLDPSLKPQADQILASTPATQPASSSDKELIRTGSADAEGTPASQPGRKRGQKVERVKYQPATPEQHAAAMQKARDRSKEVGTQLKVEFTEIETDHFIVFTDWDPREHEFLKTNLEGAYKVVSKQFDIPAEENVFVGKLPVYMFAKFNDFAKFGSRFDEFPVTTSLAGYYRGNSTGSGHMAMWKPNESLTGNNNIRDAERLWAYVLVHEFTHAFLARYRTNEFIPRWLNEGIAEVIASSKFPNTNNRSQAAYYIATSNAEVSMLFDDEFMPTGQFYPVMKSMVEMLVQTDRKKFLKMIDAIKDGTDPEDALKQQYNSDYTGFTRAWRDWMRRQNGRG